MGFTHLEKYLLYSCCNTTAEHNTAKYADGGTNLKNTMCTRSQYHIWTTSVSLFYIPISLHPAQFMIHGLLAGSSPPSAVPPTCDHHSASSRCVTHVSKWTELEKLNIICSSPNIWLFFFKTIRVPLKIYDTTLFKVSDPCLWNRGIDEYILADWRDLHTFQRGLPFRLIYVVKSSPHAAYL